MSALTIVLTAAMVFLGDEPGMVSAGGEWLRFSERGIFFG